jgi:hypothetical protein
MSINSTELITLHVTDLFKLLGKPHAGAVGSLALMSGGDHLYEADLDALCMVLKIESETETTERAWPPALKLNGHRG